jgi:hypothetical protein
MVRLIAQLEKVLAALLLIAPAAAAQTPPDFTGKWTAAAGPAAPASRGEALAGATMGSGFGPTITITQSAARLAVERAQFVQYDMQTAPRFVYALDGAESRNTINVGRGVQEFVSTAVWRDGALVITTRFRFDGPGGKPATGDITQSLALDQSGSLVVTTTVGSALGGPPATSTTTYKKG